MSLNFDDASFVPLFALDPVGDQKPARLLAAARAQLGARDFGRADATLTRLLHTDALDKEARVWRGEARYALGQFTGARQDFQQVLEPCGDAPANTPVAPELVRRAHLGLVQVISRSAAPPGLSDPESHLNAAKAFAVGQPCSSALDLLEGLARVRIEFDSNELELALASANELLQHHPDDPRPWLALTEIFDAMGDYVKASDAAEQAIVAFSDEAILTVTEVLQGVQLDTPEARQALRAALHRFRLQHGDPHPYQAALASLSNLGMAVEHQERLYQAAEEVSSSAHHNWPRDCGGSTAQSGPRRGSDGGTVPGAAAASDVSLAMTTAYPAALAAFALAAHRNRGPAWQDKYKSGLDLLTRRCGPLGFWTLITKAAQFEDMPAQAAALLQQAVQINPDDRFALKLLCRATMAGAAGGEDFTRAPLSDFIEKLGSSPRLPDKLFILEHNADVSEKNNRIPEAIGHLDELCKLTRQARYFAKRANLKLFSSNNLAEVLRDCKSALDQDAFHYLALLTQAQANLLGRNFSSAEKSAQLCRSKHPDQPDPLYILGEIATSQKQQDRAIGFYKDYLQGTFPVSRHYENQAKLQLATLLCEKRQYTEAMEYLIQIDVAEPELHEASLKVRNLVVARQQLSDDGFFCDTSRAELEALLKQGNHEVTVKAAYHHIATNMYNVALHGILAKALMGLDRPREALAWAQRGLNILEYEGGGSDTRCAWIKRKAETEIATVMSSVGNVASSIAQYFESLSVLKSDGQSTPKALARASRVASQSPMNSAKLSSQEWPRSAHQGASKSRMDAPRARMPSLTRFEEMGQKVCANVADELRDTVGWDIKSDTLQVQSVGRSAFRELIQKEYDINWLQAWVLARVLGVAYLRRLDKVVVVKEVTSRWGGRFLENEIAKSVVRLCLKRRCDQQQTKMPGNPKMLEKRANGVYSVEHRYLRVDMAMAYFLEAHAESVARSIQRKNYGGPLNQTVPLRQKFWNFLVWVTLNMHLNIRRAAPLLVDRFEQLLYGVEEGPNAQAEGRNRVNRVYGYGRMASFWYGGIGEHDVRASTRADKIELDRDAKILLALNPARGNVKPVIHFGFGPVAELEP